MFEGIDGVFFITIATLSCGFFGLVIRYCLKSKCENISCCYGLLSVQRNVELESQEEMREMELGIKEEKV
jgi:hypothetical protein